MKKIIYSLSLCTLLLAACGEQKEYQNMNEVRAEQKAQEEQAQKEYAALEAAKPIEQRIESFINNELGPETNGKKIRIVSIENKNSNIKITLNADDGFKPKHVKESALIKTKEIAKELKSYGTVNNFRIVFLTDLVDTYGNVKADQVLSIGLDKETLHAIQYENFDSKNFEQVATTYFSHLALQ